MKYLGSKNRIAKEILPIILRDRKENQWYVEPFCGGCNSIDKVTGKRIAADNNKYLIEMWKGLQQGHNFPQEISKQLYNDCRTFYNEQDQYAPLDEAYIGWVGFMASFNGRFFDGGYSGTTKDRDYVAEQIKNTLKQVPLIKDVKFYSTDYNFFLTLKEPCIVYCDPPYEGTKQYSTSKDFNHEHFWQWCKEMKSKGHQIFISEYNAPEDFKCIWQKEVTNSMHPTNTTKPIEKLFTL